MPVYLVTNLAAILVFMTLVWLLSLLKKDAGIVDIFWGLGFICLAWVSFLTAPGWEDRKILLLLLVNVWGLRLATHIFFRGQGRGEDQRYANWREQHSPGFAWWSFRYVFMLQGAIAWVVCLGFQIGMYAQEPAAFGWLTLAGLTVWLFGFFWESVGDFQLLQFMKNPENKGKVLNYGLWRYTRHPNYFGETVMWWGIFLIVLPTNYGWVTIVSPILLTFLILKVSGVTMLEKNQKEAKPKYADYIRQTSAFIPMPPKKEAE
jgi:steroid 5-alpha reductase family enzyme